MTIQMLVEALDSHFKDRVEHFEAFVEEGVQIEGWFKGEILVLLRRLKQEGRVADFFREHPSGSGRKRLDFVVDFGGKPVAIELKVWLDGLQKGTRWCAHHYCTADTTTGIGPDLKKLKESDFQRTLVLIFCYQNPGPEGWSLALSRLGESLPQYPIRSSSRPESYPPQYFMAVLELTTDGETAGI